MSDLDVDVGNYKALALAVLERALIDLQDARKQRDRIEVRKLLAWVNSDTESWVFAFVPLCEWLGFDVETMKRKIRGLRGCVDNHEKSSLRRITPEKSSL